MMEGRRKEDQSHVVIMALTRLEKASQIGELHVLAFSSAGKDVSTWPGGRKRARCAPSQEKVEPRRSGRLSLVACRLYIRGLPERRGPFA